MAESGSQDALRLRRSPAVGDGALDGVQDALELALQRGRFPRLGHAC